LESSVSARPARLGASALRQEDVTAMLAHRPVVDGDLVSPDHAIRNLLDDLIADVPYVVTHGSHRPVYEERRAGLDAARDRMEKAGARGASARACAAGAGSR